VFCEVQQDLVLRPFISTLLANLYSFLICDILTPFGWFIPVYLCNFSLGNIIFDLRPLLPEKKTIQRKKHLE
jgi:hypothetical protein